MHQSITNIAQECPVKRTTVDSWIHTLEDMLIAYEISVFTHLTKNIIPCEDFLKSLPSCVIWLNRLSLKKYG